MRGAQQGAMADTFPRFSPSKTSLFRRSERATFPLFSGPRAPPQAHFFLSSHFFRAAGQTLWSTHSAQRRPPDKSRLVTSWTITTPPITMAAVAEDFIARLPHRRRCTPATRLARKARRRRPACPRMAPRPRRGPMARGPVAYLACRRPTVQRHRPRRATEAPEPIMVPTRPRPRRLSAVSMRRRPTAAQ